MSNGFALELQKGVRATLAANSGITNLVLTRIYDEPPTPVAYPFIRFGNITPSADDTDGNIGAEVSFEIEAFGKHSLVIENILLFWLRLVKPNRLFKDKTNLFVFFITATHGIPGK